MVIQSKEDLIKYGYMMLGHPVVKLNVNIDQVYNLIDDVLQMFVESHYNGSVQMWMRHTLTQTEIDNKLIKLPANILSISDIVIPAETAGSSGISTDSIFDINYQIFMNDLFDTSSAQILDYDIVRRHLAFVDYELNPYRWKSVEFNRYEGGFTGNLNWSKLTAGTVIAIKGQKMLDPQQAHLLFNDRFVKAYFVALLKRQWATNLRKFAAIPTLAGMTVNADNLMAEAQQEIKDLEEKLKNEFREPLIFLVA